MISSIEQLLKFDLVDIISKDNQIYFIKYVKVGRVTEDEFNDCITSIEKYKNFLNQLKRD